MTSFKARDVTGALLRKGMEPARPGDHKRFVRITPTGLKITTMVAHGSTGIDDHLITLMARQCRLSRRQFIDLVNCPFTQEDWDLEIARRENTDS